MSNGDPPSARRPAEPAPPSAGISPNDDLAAEQAYLDHAQRCLEAMRRRTGHAVDSLAVAARSDADAAAARAHLRARLFSLDDSQAALCFGRLDEAGPRGDTHYVGRRHVEDEATNAVVVDWRAPVAAAFYRATAVNDYGLHRRRRFSLAGGELVGCFDEVFDDPDHPELALGGGVPDPLLAELDRARVGEMRDIVATIQSEQDEIIRAPLDQTVLVQGGPGTGKTAVGLHRAAYLLYAHREALEGRRVLVVGPNRLFLRYISAVLPSLGETAVTQHTVESLAGGSTRYRERVDDDPPVAELKGDERLAAVLRAALVGLMKPAEDDVRLPTRFGVSRLDAATLNLLVADVLGATSTFAAGRDVLRRRLAALVHRQFFDPATGAGPDEAALALPSDRVFAALVTRLWPTVSAPVLVRRVLTNVAACRAAAAGILTSDEQRLLQRRTGGQRPSRRAALAPEHGPGGRAGAGGAATGTSRGARGAGGPWSLADLALLDEAEALLGGPPAVYGHVVVDEVQELSPMALRMVARRAPRGSFTVLGDLAQATSPASATSWDDIAAHLGAPGGTRAELVTGYRLPAAILDWAAGLLPLAAPGLTPPRSVRAGGTPPRLRAAGHAELVAETVAAVAAVAQRWGLVGVVAPLGQVEVLAAALRSAGVDVGDGGRDAIDRPVTVLSASGAKGLEFDAAIVVEPAAIVAEAGEVGRGHRALYVALTRCVHELVVVHAEPLPAALAPLG